MFGVGLATTMFFRIHPSISFAFAPARIVKFGTPKSSSLTPEIVALDLTASTTNAKSSPVTVITSVALRALPTERKLGLTETSGPLLASGHRSQQIAQSQCVVFRIVF